MSRQKQDFQRQLPKIIEALKKDYRPQKIILFGSVLDQNQESHDIDLLLIKNTPPARLGWRAGVARK
jgi:predicted nucleotidyltransferase